MLMTLAALGVHASETATVLVFGDSISSGYGIQPEQGWVALLQKRLNERGLPYRAVNASASGETTSGGAARLPAVLRQHEPEVVIIELGGNDGLRGTPIAEIKRNLGRMIEAADPARRKILVVAMSIHPNYGHRYTSAFSKLFAEVADEHGVALASNFIESVALSSELMQNDGTHPNAAGQPLLLDALWSAIKPLLD